MSASPPWAVHSSSVFSILNPNTVCRIIPLAILGCYGFTHRVSIVLAQNPIAKGASLRFQTPISVLGLNSDLDRFIKIWHNNQYESPPFSCPHFGAGKGDREGFMLIRIRDCDKNITSTEQPGVSSLRPKPTLYLQASYAEIALYLGCHVGRYKLMLGVP